MSISNTEHSEAGAYAYAAGSAPPASPVLVTRGESNPSNLAHIDWLAFTVHPAESRDWRWLRVALKDIFNIPAESWQGTTRKWSGYQHRVNLITSVHRGESLNLGLVAYGGDSQRGTMHVSLNAQACARITDWSLVMAWLESVEAVITRVDTAHDDFEGKTINIEIVRKWYEEGLFKCNGRPPAAELIDDLDSGKGKTFYVGKRANGKLGRFYEKGKKEGDPNSPWFRGEVEFRNKSRVIPLDIVIHPGHYIAGAFPCLSYLSVEQSKIKTIKNSASINYQCMVKNLRNMAGKGVYAMLQVEKGNQDAVIQQIVREGMPKRLEPFIGMPEVLNRDQHENVNP